MNRKYTDSTGFLYATPTVTEGAARIIDLGGTFTRYNNSASAEAADERALRSDWMTVGQDIRQALEQFKKQVQKETTNDVAS